jgi:hypothetical protein
VSFSVRLKAHLLALLGAVLILVSVAVDHLLPAANEVKNEPARRYPRASCSEANDRLEAAKTDGRYHQRFVLETSAFVLHADCGDESAYTISCEGVTLPLQGSPTCDASGEPLRATRGPNALLLEPVPPGRLAFKQVCWGCTQVSAEKESRARDGAIIFRGFLAALGGLGLLLLVRLAVVRRRERPFPLRLVGTSGHELPASLPLGPGSPPDEIELERLRDGEIARIDYPRIAVLDGELRPAEGDPPPAPRIDLGGDGDFRRAARTTAALIGPGRVNGLPVAPGREALVEDRDVVEIGKERFRVHMPGRARTALRYHRDEKGRLRFFRPRQVDRWHERGLLLGIPVALMVLAGVPPIFFRSMVLAYAGLVVLIVAASWVVVPRLAVRVRPSEPFEPEEGRLTSEREILDQLVVVERDDGGYRLEARRADGEQVVLEEVGGPRREDEAALLEALRLEVESIQRTVSTRALG